VRIDICFAWCRDSSPGTLSDLRSASVNNTRLASVAVLHKIHTFIRHCSSSLFHDIGLFVEQLQQAVADQEKQIIEQQKILRRQQRLAAARAAAAEGGGIAMSDGRVSGKQKAGEEDLNEAPPKRHRSGSPDSQDRRPSSSPPGSSPEASPEKQNLALASTHAQTSTQPESTQLESASRSPQEASTLQHQPVPGEETLQIPARLPSGIAFLAPSAEAHAAGHESAQDINEITMEPETAEAVNGSASTAGAETGANAADGAPGKGDKPAAEIMDLEHGVEHPLGGPKLDRPKSKRKKNIYTKEPAKV